MVNIFDFLGKKVVDIKCSKSIGNVCNFIFSARLHKILYIKTDQNYYFSFNKIIAINDVIVTNSHLANIDENLFTIAPDLQAIKTDGIISGKVGEIVVNDSGILSYFLVNNTKYFYKDIYNLGNDIVLLVSDVRKKPISIKKPKKNSPVHLIKPTKKENIMSEKLTDILDDIFDDKDDDLDIEDNEEENDNENNDSEENDDDNSDEQNDDESSDDDNDDTNDDDNDDTNDDEEDNNNENKDDENTDEDNKNEDNNSDSEEQPDNNDIDNLPSNKTKNKVNTVIIKPVKINTDYLNFVSSKSIRKNNTINNICFNGCINMSVSKMPKKIICNQDMLIGKTITNNIYFDNGKPLIKKDMVISPKTIIIAGKSNKLIDITKYCK